MTQSVQGRGVCSSEIGKIEFCVINQYVIVERGFDGS